MSSEKPNLLEAEWVLSPYNKVPSFGSGEAPQYVMTIREAGSMPVRVVARLDFGYGKKTDEAVARSIVFTHNRYERLQREHAALLEFVRTVARSGSLPPDLAHKARSLTEEADKP